MSKNEALYVCQYCESHINCHPASDLNLWFNDELICDECLSDKSPEDKEEGNPRAFVPLLERQNADILAMLKRVDLAIELADEDFELVQEIFKVTDDLRELIKKVEGGE